MSVPELLKEDDEYIYCQRYIHDDPDETPDWIWNEDMTKWKYPDEIVYAIDGAAYELLLKYRVRKSDAEVLLDSIE